jgi:hypothetical protein
MTPITDGRVQIAGFSKHDAQALASQVSGA